MKRHKNRIPAGFRLAAGLLLATQAAFADTAAHSQQKEEDATGATLQEQQLQLNFRGAPLDTVLDYLSQAAGFVIVRDAPLSGTVDIISHQPLHKDEAVELLHTVLNDRGYALLRTGRILRIVKRDEALVRDLPVGSGSDPAMLPRSGAMITQIIPVRHTNAARLIDTLKPLMPAGTVISANDDSNALVVTDTQTNIHRLMRIIQALDTTVSSILDIKVMPLQYADAQETAAVINKVYETPTQRSAAAQNVTNRRMSAIARFRGFGGQGGDTDADAGGNDIKQTANYVNAVPDERANAVVVTAPAEVISQIQDLVAQLDSPTEAFSTLRVFVLQYADATEMANVIVGLYPDSDSSRNPAARVDRRGPMPPQQQAAGNGESKRRLAEAKVMAVADTRMNSIIVSASPSTMTDIEAVVRELDATPENVPTVYIYQLKNADVLSTREILENMFSGSEAPTTRARTGTTRTTTTNPAANPNSAGNGTIGGGINNRTRR